MNDEQMQSLLDAWYRDRDEAPRAANGGLERVMAKVPEVRQRGRWWPLPAFVRPVSTFPSRELAPALIPATNGRTPTRGFTMFSAVKFVVAAAIVALLGGFLLAGVLTTPQGDEVLPAAVTESPSPMTESPSPMTESPSPMTTEELLSGMVTEEVEPGVFRVVDDGYRDLSYPVRVWGGAGFIVDVTPDGGVWLSSDAGSSGLYRLGEERVFEGPAAYPPYREVAPDGSLWAIGQVSGGRNGIFSFDGEVWTERATTTTDGFSALAVGPDGTVWVMGDDRDKYCPDIDDIDCSGPVLLRLEDDGSLTTIEDWSDVYDGEPERFRLAVSPDGDVWLVGALRHRLQGAKLLLRFDGEGWEAIPSPEGWNSGTKGRYLDIGPDGALWVKARATGDLARFDDRGWATFTEADGVKRWGEKGTSWTDLLEVAADGSVWLRGGPPDEGCGGVTHYDGATWTSYLAGSCIEDFAIAPDGSVWLGADDMNRPISELSRLHVYVITPEAVTAAE